MNRKIIYVVNSASSFLSHRYDAYLDLVRKGEKVKIIIGKSIDKEIESKSLKKLDSYKADYTIMNFKSSGLNPFIELINLIILFRFLSKEKPDTVHSIALKPIIISGLATLFLPKIKNIFAISGLGYIFTKRKKIEIRNLVLRLSFFILFKIILIKKNNFFIVQNNYDRNFILNLKVNSNKINLIPGCGIDLDLFKPGDYKLRKNSILFPARLLKDKGLYDFVEAANILKPDYPEWEFIIAGSSNSDNPTSLTKDELKLLEQNKNIKLLGFVDNMIEIYKNTKIICLPSYREGMPRSIQEAMACGCAIITTDVPGCNEVIIDNYCGFLSHSKDPTDLSNKIKKLITNENLIKNFSINSRNLASKRYSNKNILNLFYNFYKFVSDFSKNKEFIISIDRQKFLLNRNNIQLINQNLDFQKKIILIFGPSGFIGNSLINYLEKNENFQIVYLSRNLNIDDLNDKETILIWKKNLQFLDPFLNKIHSVIYLISKNKYKNNEPDINKLYFINNEILKTIYCYLVNKKVKNFIYASSIKVYGDQNINNKPFSLSSKTSPNDHYGKSKVKAENIIIQYSQTSTHYKILRFPMVYGNNIRKDFKKFFLLFKFGFPVPFGNIKNKRSFINIENLNEYLEKVINSKSTNNKILLLSDSKNYSTSDILKIILEKQKYKNNFIYLNPKIIMIVSYLLGYSKLTNKLFQNFTMDTSESFKLLNDK